VNDHPTPAELESFLHGKVGADRVRSIVLHFLRGCASCRAAAEPLLRVMLGPSVTALPARQEVAYDRAIDRAFAALREKKDQAALASVSLLAGGEPSSPDGNAGLDDLALFEDFLARSWALRYQDPEKMVELACFAVSVAARLSTRLYGPKRVKDLQCRAWTELANAHRVADDLDEAENALGRAAELYLDGSGDELLGVRLYDVYASLCADRRRFALALDAIDTVYDVYKKRGDLHGAGRALISKGIYTGYAGRPEEAIRLLDQGLARIEDRREPGLAFLAIHNQLCFLVDLGRYEEARRVLARSRPRCEPASGRVSRIKLRWLEGRIHAGLGRLGEAERDFRAVRREFEQAALGYNAALASLDLAAVCLRRGDAAEAKRAAVAAVEVFRALQIHREALTAVLLLESALERGIATVALLEKVAGFLRQAEGDETARFEPHP
jgi:tetratricopeptide (TPR) repeat protein